jgi:anthranilate synthase component 2
VKLLLIDHEDSFVYNLAQAFGELGADVRVARYTIPPQSLRSFDPDAVVFSPGPGAPADVRLSRLARSYLSETAESIPILGVCFGHELIGEVFGGRVVRAHMPVHGEVAAIMHDGTGLFHGLPRGFEGARYHSLVLSRTHIPDELAVAATTPEGTVMAVRHVRRPIWGVQFHPESYLTRCGPRLLENFLRMVAP